MLRYALDYTLVSQQRRCNGLASNGCLQKSVADCARSCQHRAAMFAFGNGDKTCDDGKCICLCETSAIIDGTCAYVSVIGYNLYKYESLAGKVYVKYLRFC